MKAIRVSEIANIVGGTLYGSGDGVVTSVAIDSRKVRKNSMFAAFVGEKVDGHDYIGNAFKNGASCCVGSYVPEGETRPVIIVDDVLTAIQKLASWYRSTLTLPVIGITGSVGKTTTKEMIASVLEAKFYVLKTTGSLNNELGLPLTLLQIEEEHDVAVIEMGISHFQEMTRLAMMTRPDIGVFTMVGLSHLENLEDRCGVLRAKTEMIDYMNPDGVVIANGDDDLLNAYVPDGKTKITYGKDPHCDVYVRKLQTDSSSTICEITDGKERLIHAAVNAYGDHIIYAVLAAVTVGIRMGLTDEEIPCGLERYRTIGSRSRVIRTKENLTLIDDCYNASPESMRNAVTSLKRFPGRRIAILGDMLELGEDRNIHHYALGEFAAECELDLIVGVGSLSALTSIGALTAGGNSKHFRDKEELISQLPHILRKEDVVLVKASRAMKFEEIVEAIQSLDLREQHDK